MSRAVAEPLACVLALGASAALGVWTEGPRWAPRPVMENARPARIVSLSVASDELALALVPERARILALTRFADDPGASNEVEAARTVQGRVTALAEEVLALGPDLVLAPRWSAPELMALLAHEGVAVHAIDTPSSIDEVRASIAGLGAALDARPDAEALVHAMDARLARVAVQVAQRPGEVRGPRVVLWSDSGVTPAGGTLFCEAVERAGARCALAEQGARGYVPLTLEGLLALDPDVVVEARYRADGRARPLGADAALAELPAGRGLRAVRTGRVLALPTAHVLSTTHHVADLVEGLARLVAEGPP